MLFLCADFYGRLHPYHTAGTVRLCNLTNDANIILHSLLRAFDEKVDKRLLVRRLGVNANEICRDEGIFQLDLFTDYTALEKEKRIQKALMEARSRYGGNAVLKGISFLDGATTKERNGQIGGHRK